MVFHVLYMRAVVPELKSCSTNLSAIMDNIIYYCLADKVKMN